MVPYAEKSGFSETDADLLWESLSNMFENDKSTGRPDMGSVKLVVFKHNSRMGSFPSWKLNNVVVVNKNDGVVSPRDVSDYTITIDEELRKQLDGKVELIEKL
jgi:CRISPR-associated protein Csd2